MSTTNELAKLLFCLATDESVDCPIALFSRSVLSSTDGSGDSSIYEAVAQEAENLEAADAAIDALVDQNLIARDKLQAELQRVERELQGLEKKKKEIAMNRRFAKIALTGMLTAPNFAGSEGADSGGGHIGARQDSGDATTMRSSSAGGQQNLASGPSVQEAARTHSVHARTEEESATSARSAGGGVGARDVHADPALSETAGNVGTELAQLTALLQRPGDVKETTLVHALSRYEPLSLVHIDHPWEGSQRSQCLALVSLLVSHLLQPRPPVQVIETRILIATLKRAANLSENDRDQFVRSLLEHGGGMNTCVKLLGSVNDDVKAEILELLSLLVSGEEGQIQFADSGGVPPLVNIVATSTSELVLERALVVLWTALTCDTIKQLVRECDGIRAIVDLLYTDSIPILENVTIALGYLTREDLTKVAIRECQGLEKVISTLHHPSESIQSKAAGAIWNCASNPENRVYLRHLGCIPALIELLHSPNEHVQENAGGALWNLAVDQENKSQILDYGGLPAVVELLHSHNETTVENATGVLWNCTAIVENRAAVRKANGIPPLLALLNNPNERTQENVAGTLRNLAVNDQNKAAIREAGGIEKFLEVLRRGISQEVNESVLDKVASALWISTVAPENRHAVRTCQGFDVLLQLLHRRRDSLNEVIMEKIIGTLRNCAAVPENRHGMLEGGTLKVIASLCAAKQASLLQSRAPFLEGIAGTIWNLSRDDKTLAAREGLVPVLCEMLPSRDDAVIEQVCGAISSLTINNTQNRDIVRQCRGMERLSAVFLGRRISPERPIMMQNILLALRNCTTASDENVAIAVQHGVVTKLLEYCKTGSEDIARESALTLKNVSGNPRGADEVVRLNGVTELTRVAEKSTSEAVKKAISMALQAVTRTARAGPART